MKYSLILFSQSVLLILLAPLLTGILRYLKAYIRGYNGPPILQMYYDLGRLFKKGRVISKTSSFITRIGPMFSLAAVVAAAFLVPVFFTSEKTVFGNIFMIIFAVAIAKFFSSLIGLDCASTFGGMGSSRELFISMFAEPVIFIITAFLYFETKSFNVFNISLANSTGALSVEHIIAATAFFVVILAENTRMPVDNPETHLELTMVHEAMILDISGKDLAFIELASSIKLALFLTIFINCFIPYGISVNFGLLPVILFIVKIFICLGIIATIETIMAKFRLFRVPELLAAAFSLGLIAITMNYFL